MRLYVEGRERWYRCDAKSQAKALCGRLKAEQREGRYFEKAKPVPFRGSPKNICRSQIPGKAAKAMTMLACTDGSVHAETRMHRLSPLDKSRRSCLSCRPRERNQPPSFDI